MGRDWTFCRCTRTVVQRTLASPFARACGESYSGNLKTLPKDYVGERHVVIVKREPAGASGNFEWCEFEERPGPAPRDAREDDGITIHLIYRDVEIPQWPRTAGRDEGVRANRCIYD
jgi:hypothetical protein